MSDDQVTTPLMALEPSEVPTIVAPAPVESAERQQFKAGDVIATRFRVTRFIAKGGMGEVYEVEDLDLHERVALKTIRVDVSVDNETLDRFRREVHLAHKVTHPNVCRVFDVGRHEGLLFLTMEYLEGETLAHYIRKLTRLEPAAAFPIVEQIAAGLAAAHAAGIVHRDFKSANVMLTPLTDGTCRPVIADFGLAHGDRSADTFAASIAVTGKIAGTPAYMAPEQVSGGEITPATDIYALGIVLYEMVTGTRPFRSDSPLATALKRLDTPPERPRHYVPDLDPTWEQVILRCLERNPADRFSRATDIPRALTTGDLTPSRRAHRRVATIAVLLFVALGVGIGGYIRLGRLTAPTRVSQVAPDRASPVVKGARRSIAVVGFRNLTGKQETAWLSTALAELYDSELAAGQTLRVIPGETVARMKIETHLAETDTLAPDSLQKIRSAVGAELVVVGTYLAVGENIRIDVHLQDTARGETLHSVIGNGTQKKLSALIATTGAELRRKIGVKDAPILAADIADALPSNPDAARLYAMGLDRLRTFDALGARDYLEQVVAIEPQYALAHSALAAAWSSLGYDSRARDEAKKAYDVSKKLRLEDRLLIEARYREATKDWRKAQEVYRTLWNLTPDNLDYGLALARVSVSGGGATDGLAVLDVLRKRFPATRDDARIDIGESGAAYALGDLQRARNASGRAAAKAAKAGSQLLLARARLQESQANLQLGDFKRGSDTAAEAKRIYEKTGNRGGVADALVNLAVALYYQGDLRGARDLYEESLAVKRQTGDKAGMAKLLNNIGAIDIEHGDLDSAKTLFEESLALHREIDDVSGIGSVLSNIAAIFVARGDLAPAKSRYEQSLDIARRTGDKSAISWAESNIAAIVAEQGDLTEAMRTHEKALLLEREIGDKNAIADSLISIAGILRKQDELAKAQARLSEALAVYTEIQLPDGIFTTRLALADLAREDHRAPASELMARECADHFKTEQAGDREAEARAVLAGALLDQHKTAAAMREVELAEQLGSRSHDTFARMSVGVTAARVRATSGRSSDVTHARQSLMGSLKSATSKGWIAQQFEIRLALGEIEMKVSASEGRTRLEDLERDARARGFLLVARMASEIRRAAA